MNNVVNVSNFSLWVASRRLMALALPMAGSQCLNVASGFLCMAMLATLGHEVLAASALIFTTQLSIMVSGMSMLFAVSVLVGHCYGAQHYSAIGNYVQQGWIVACILGLPIMLLFWHIDTVLLFFGQTQQIAAIVHDYFHAFVWAVIPGLLSTCNMQFGYGIGRKGIIVVSSLLSVLVLLITAYLLIFGKFGLPRLGVAGLGYATLAQYSFFVILTTLIFYYDKSFVPFNLFHYKVDQRLKYFASMFTVGWPISVQMAGEMLSFFISGIMVGWLGTTALAAFQIVNQYYFLIVIPIFSLSQASSILVGQACGAKQQQAVRTLSYASIAIVLLVSSCVAAVFLAFPKSLAAIYMNVSYPANAATLQLTIVIFSIIAFSQVCDALRNVLLGILRGLFDTRFPMYMNLVTIWLIGMPLSYLLAFSWGLGATGFVLGGMLGMLAAAALMVQRWYQVVKKEQLPREAR